MKRKIIMNTPCANNVADMCAKLIHFVHEVEEKSGKRIDDYEIRFRLPKEWEVNAKGMPIEYCSQRVLELTIPADELM